ncbi:zinc-dependent alcohol dehydrogenase family protein [Streptomyces palmae]|uniref:alcohol dehydrogenase n=1 Tax=Streptomyces palmae TaxID=1701085 RepID=A0A4Z0HD51_9ACTN|nr:zinc-dependent alcohol dehydrogenase family protein [Streptomyces palmae]TGB18274.1 zinc-binding alcohol dehydrogenase family protein [Streptomyces palmae]
MASRAAGRTASTARAWVVERPGPIASGPLRLVTRGTTPPGPYELGIRVRVCGVCRTDLHLAEGDLPPRAPRRTPGHEVVGRVEAVGERVSGFHPGERVGAAWLAGTCGDCRYCRTGRENLCPYSRYTGWDIDGGFADHLVVDARYAYRVPDGWTDEEAAPLLCAGIIGYRALERSRLPSGGRLGLYGFGASAHLTAQLALARGAVVHVVTRSESARHLALELGAASASRTAPPEPLDSAILFAPAGPLVPAALAALDRGGTLAVAGIHLTAVPPLDYDRHLFQERTLCSVTANTRRDGRAYLAEAAELRPAVRLNRYPLDEADRALADLAAGRITGVAVLDAR